VSKPKPPPAPTVKSHGQVFYESSGNRLTAWEKLSKISQQAYTIIAARYDELVGH
jgi:hypothetical protein